MILFIHLLIKWLIEVTVEAIKRPKRKKHHKPSAMVLAALDIAHSRKAQKMNLQVTLNDDQQVTGAFQVLDAKGLVDPAATISWAVADPTVASFSTADPTGLSVTLVAQKPGQTVLTGTSGALSVAVAVTVIASADTQINGSFGSPTTQPAPAPATPTP